MLELVIATFLTGLIGLLINHFYQRYIEAKRICSLEKALSTELGDIRERLQLICFAYERSIQIGALGGIDNSIPPLISNVIFEKYYEEIFSYLRASQRKSYEIINNYVKSLNSGIERLQELHNEVTSDLSEDMVAKWNDYLSAQYQNAAIAYWHASYHLKNPEFPFLDREGSLEYKSMLKATEDAKTHVRKLIQDAKDNLTREMFE